MQITIKEHKRLIEQLPDEKDEPQVVTEYKNEKSDRRLNGVNKNGMNKHLTYKIPNMIENEMS